MNREKEKVNLLSVLSIICAVVAMIFNIGGLAEITTEGFAIAFALLSRGNKRMCTQAKIGLGLGIVALFFNAYSADQLFGAFFRLMRMHLIM